MSSVTYNEIMTKKSFFAKKLIAIRKAKGLSQRDLAKVSGISRRMIVYYEGPSSIPDIEVLRKLSKALDVSVGALVDSNYSSKDATKIDTRTMKKIKLLQQLSLEDQRKVVDYIKLLISRNENNNKNIASS